MINFRLISSLDLYLLDLGSKLEPIISIETVDWNEQNR